MIELAIMIEGQNGLNWHRWQQIGKAVEELGFSGLYRSDHYTNSRPPDKDSLELWVSLTWLASNTRRIEFGSLVSPLSFRNPTMTARMASAVDDLSGGRFHLGLGAGWQEREHNNFGWDLLAIPDRFARFEEGLEVITKLLTSDEPSDFSGNFYRLDGAILLPRPQRKGGPPIVIGGNGPRRTLPLVARYATEWNAIMTPASKIIELNTQLDKFLDENDRAPEDVKRSLMSGFYFAYDEQDAKQQAAIRNQTPEELRKTGRIFGTANQIVDQLGELEEAGLYRVMLQWLDLDDLERLEIMANKILPQIN